jgi:hypothetical protein
MATKGTGLLMVWADVPANKEDEFNRWYNEEHVPERLAVPGFLSGARYEAVKGGPKHLACYELESVAVLASPAYKRVHANPTEWTRRCSPEVLGTTYIRNVYTMIHPRALPPEAASAGMAPALQIGRMDVPPEIDREFNDWSGSTCPTTRRSPASSGGAAIAPRWAPRPISPSTTSSIPRCRRAPRGWPSAMSRR